jgi:hypothetical protein
MKILNVSPTLVLLPEEDLHHRGEHRVCINVVLVVQLLNGASLTKMDHPEGF